MPITKKVYSYTNARKQMARYKKPMPIRQNQKLKNMLNANEYKFFDTEINTGGDEDSITVISDSLVLMQTGDGSQNRDGNKCLLTSLYIDGVVTRSTALGPIDAVLDYYVILDRQSNGQAASVISIFNDDTYDSFLNLDNKKRFKVLKKKHILLPVQGLAYNAAGAVTLHPATRRSVKIALPKLNIPLMYDATSGAITDLSSNNILLLVKVSGPAVTHNLRARVRFLG